MSKQADEVLLNDISNLLEDYADQTGTRYIIKPQIMPLANQVDLFIQTNYTPNHLVEQKCLEARIDERQTFRKLWNNLGLQFGASAGSATGVTVRNSYGEEFVFQLDRDAVNAIFKHMNDRKLTNLQNKEDE